MNFFSVAGPGPILFYVGRLNSARCAALLDTALPQFAADQFGDQDADCILPMIKKICYNIVKNVWKKLAHSLRDRVRNALKVKGGSASFL